MAKIIIETNFVKADVNIKKGDIVRLKDEGEQKEMTGFDGQPKKVWQFNLELPSGETKLYTMNVSTQKVLIAAWGDETAEWVGKPLEVLIEKKIIKGQVIKTISLVPAEESDKKKIDDIPIIEDGEEPVPDDFGR